MTEPVIVNAQTVVHVKLINEAVLVWRPVLAEKIDLTTYFILDQPIPADEVWEFQPKTIVTVTLRHNETGDHLVAVEKINFS